MPPFFVPDCDEADWENLYVKLALVAGRAPCDPERRIRAIDFVHDGWTWTAEVGSQLRGTIARERRVRGTTVARSEHKTDPATVLAIFPGTPWIVVTNAWSDRKVVSYWVNPFLAGQPASVKYFSPRNSRPAPLASMSETTDSSAGRLAARGI